MLNRIPSVVMRAAWLAVFAFIAFWLWRKFFASKVL